MTSIRWVNEYRALPKSFTLTERIDRKALEVGMKNPYVDHHTLITMNGLLKSLSPDNLADVRYVRKDYGRFYPQDDTSANIWRLVRWDIVPKEIADLDAVACSQNCMVQLCRLSGANSECYNHIEAYARDRKPYLESLKLSQEMVRAHNEARHENHTAEELGKLIMTAYCYGGGPNAWRALGLGNRSPIPQRGLAAEFKRQWKDMAARIVSDERYSEIVNYAKNKKVEDEYHDASGLSTIIFSYEALAVYNLMQSFIGGGYTVRTYEFDGFTVENPPEDMEIPADLAPIPFIWKARGTPLSATQFDYEPKQKPPAYKKKGDEPDDKDVANMVLDQFKNDIMCVNNDIYVRDNNVFSPDKADRRLGNIIARLDLPGGRNRKWQDLDRMTKYTMQAALSVRDIMTDTHSVVKETRGKLCFQNGVLDLATGQFTEDIGSTRTFIQIPGNYEPNAVDASVETRVEEIIKSIFTDEQYTYFMRVLSRAVAGHYEDKVWVILLGERNSGKGVIQELMQLLGRYCCSINAPLESDETDLPKYYGQFFSSGCDKARVAFSNEANTNGTHKKATRLNGDAIKKFVSVGDVIPARLLHKNTIDYHFTAIPFMCFNSIPDCSRSDAFKTNIMFNMP